MEDQDKSHVNAIKIETEQHELVLNMLDVRNAFKQFCALPKRERTLINNTMHVMGCDTHPLNKKQ